MKCRGLAILIIACFLAAPLTADAQEKEERYLCVADKIVGFQYNPNSNSWEMGYFDITDNKFLISQANGYKNKYDIKRVGQDQLMCRSHQGFNELGTARFECVGGEFFFNKETGRYTHGHTRGYVFGNEDKRTPFIEIGKCSPF